MKRATFVRSAAVVSLIASCNFAQANTPAGAPTTRPGPVVIGQDKPATRPSAKVDAAAHELLAKIATAYTGVSQLELKGTIAGQFDVGGRQQQFNSSLSSAFSAPARFRHESDGTLMVANGEKAYIFNTERSTFAAREAARTRGFEQKVPAPIADILGLDAPSSDPGLLLALMNDVAAELPQQAASIQRGEDQAIDGANCESLKLTLKDKEVVTLLFDAKSHLLRRAATDLAGLYAQRNAVGFHSAVITVDYTTIKVNEPLAADLFAWTPPKDARDVSGTLAAGNHPTDDEEAAVLPGAANWVGKPAPDLALNQLGAERVSLADLRGNVVVLDFWATWCGPCRAALPHVNNLANDADRKTAGLRVFAVNLQEKKETITPYMEKEKLTLPVLLDADGAAAKAYGVTGIPTTVVIGRDGIIKSYSIGFAGPEALHKAVDAALAEGGGATTQPATKAAD